LSSLFYNAVREMIMTKAIKLVVSGALGRMGSRILALASQDPDFKIIGAVEAAGKSEIGKEVLPGIKVNDDLKSLLFFKGGDILIIYFTTPDGTLMHLRQILETPFPLSSRKKIAIVIGTTGFTGQQLEEVRKASKKIPVLLSPNMSIGDYRNASCP
jgi:4-hydroxy-tetrahydrodipicolinate reductase